MKQSNFTYQQRLTGTMLLSFKSTAPLFKLRSFFCLLFCIAFLSKLHAQNSANRPRTPNDDLISFQVNDDGGATFKLYAPNAKAVELAGDVKADKITREENGVWTMTTAAKIEPSAYRYYFLVDGMKVNDPKNPMVADFRPMAEIVPKGETLFWQKKDVPHGLMSIVYYESKATKSTRRMFVWTPPGYIQDSKKLPVLYLMHGGGDNDTNWPGQGKAGWILDNLFAEKKIVPMVVVMPDGSVPVETFSHDLGSNIIPYIESNFRVQADTRHRAIAGLSMGGIEVLETLMNYPDKFTYVSVMSSGWFVNNADAIKKNEERLKTVAPVLKKNIKYFKFTTGGKTDMASNNTSPTRDIFTKYGIISEFGEMNGGHTMYVWKYDLHDFAQKIFK